MFVCPGHSAITANIPLGGYAPLAFMVIFFLSVLQFILLPIIPDRERWKT